MTKPSAKDTCSVIYMLVITAMRYNDPNIPSIEHLPKGRICVWMFRGYRAQTRHVVFPYDLIVIKPDFTLHLFDPKIMRDGVPLN